MVTVGNKKETVESVIYDLYLVDKDGKVHGISAVGMDQISSTIQPINTSKISKILNVPEGDINRPDCGEVDLLIGLQFAAYHPVCLRKEGHLLLYQNQFGFTIGGCHPEITERTIINDSCLQIQASIVMHTQSVTDGSFFDIESLGVTCSPRCGGCKCGKCHPGGKDMSLQEESEYKMIEERLQFDEAKGRWIAKYPWVMDPIKLENNRKVALATLYSMEKRLLKNPDYRQVYTAEIEDMLDRKVAREVTEKELSDYGGPDLLP